VALRFGWWIVAHAHALLNVGMLQTPPMSSQDSVIIIVVPFERKIMRFTNGSKSEQTPDPLRCEAIGLVVAKLAQTCTNPHSSCLLRPADPAGLTDDTA
jgi:hypothetical protein